MDRPNQCSAFSLNNYPRAPPQNFFKMYNMVLVVRRGWHSPPHHLVALAVVSGLYDDVRWPWLCRWSFFLFHPFGSVSQVYPFLFLVVDVRIFLRRPAIFCLVWFYGGMSSFLGSDFGVARICLLLVW
jgi:hypothetical protein